MTIEEQRYQEECIVIAKRCWKDEAMTIPFDLTDIKVEIQVIKTSNGLLVKDIEGHDMIIPDSAITKIGQDFAYIITRENSQLINFNIKLQFSFIQNDCVMKIYSSDIVINSAKQCKEV